MILQLSPEHASRSNPTYERISYAILCEDEHIGSVVINRVELRSDFNEAIDEFTEDSVMHGALQAAMIGSWGDVSIVDYIASLRIDEAFRGYGLGAQALSLIPSPAGSWQVLLPFPLEPIDGVSASEEELDSLRRYWMRSGFRSTSEEVTSTYMVRNSG